MCDIALLGRDMRIKNLTHTLNLNLNPAYLTLNSVDNKSKYPLGSDYYFFVNKPLLLHRAILSV